MADANGPDLKDIERRMEGALESLKNDFGGLRTGRASANLLDNIVVNAYGSDMPMAQVGTVSVPESRMVAVNVWDKSLVASVEKAIRESNLGVNPVTDGQNVRVPLPPLTEERRKELAKLAGQYSEKAKIAIRNVRRDGMDDIKKATTMPEDDQKHLSEEIQKLTDAFVKRCDEMASAKEEEIMTV